MKENQRIEKSIQKMLLLLVSGIYLLFFSGYTSPLFPKYLNYDSAVFMMDARGILAGKKMYTDIFDHKGPVFMLIETIGMLGGRIGVFFMQTVFLWADLLLLDKMIDCFVNVAGEHSDSEHDKGKNRKKWLIYALFLLLLAYPLSNGNLTEEYSLPFIFLPLYLFLKDMRGREEPALRNSYVYGICFGILAFIRLNNAVTICGIILCWIMILCQKRKIKMIFVHIGVGFLGIMTVVVPVILYFWMRGSLYDMIYATFLFNLRYSSGMTFIKNAAQPKVFAHIVILFSPILAAMLVIFVKLQNRKLMAALEWICVLNIFSLFLGQGYNHYFTVAVPLEVWMGICILFSLRNDKKGVLQLGARIAAIGILAGYLALSVRIVVLNIKDYYVDGTVTAEYETVGACLGQIPQEDRAYVLGFDIPAKYYLMGNVLPCFKYGILQENWSVNNPKVMEETLDHIARKDVRWIVTQPMCENTALSEMLAEQFTAVEENEYCVLYRRK